MQLAIIIGIVIVTVLVIAKFGNPDFSNRKKYESDGLERLEKIIGSLGYVGHIKFFTDGHPYVWVEVSYEQAQNIVRGSCQSPYPRGGPIPASFETKIDNERLYIYIIRPRIGKLHWPELQHYEEFVKENAKFSERISAYKGND